MVNEEKTGNQEAKKKADEELAAAAKKLAAPSGTVAAEKTGGVNTPSTPSIHDANRANSKAANANAIMKDPDLSQSVISEKTGAQMPFITPPEKTPPPPPPVDEIRPPVGNQPEPVHLATTDLPAMGGVPPVTGPGVPTAEDTSAQNAVVEEVKANPKIGEQMLQLAKDTGRSILEIIQGFAKGYSGSDIPLASQVREERNKVKQAQAATAEQAQKDRDFQIARDKANQDFQMAIEQIQNNWKDRQFVASTEAEQKAADQQREFEAQEAKKNRDTTLAVANVGKTPSVNQQQEGLSGAYAQIAKALSGK